MAYKFFVPEAAIFFTDCLSVYFNIGGSAALSAQPRKVYPDLVNAFAVSALAVS